MPAPERLTTGGLDAPPPSPPASDDLPEAGETAARAALDAFIRGPLGDYADARDRLDGEPT